MSTTKVSRITLNEETTSVPEKLPIPAHLASQSSSDSHSNELIDNLPIGVYRTTRDGRILLANPALIQMLGYQSFEELATRNLEKKGFEPEYPRSDFIAKIEREGRVRGLCSIWQRADGQRLYVSENARIVRDENGRIKYYEGTVEDISGKKWLDQPAAKQVIDTATEVTSAKISNDPVHLRTLALFENAPDPAYTLSIDGKIQWFNGAFEAFTGYTRSASIGKNFDLLLHPKDLAMAQSDFRLAVAGQLPPPRQTRYCHPSGDIRIAHRVISPRFDTSHGVVDIFVIDHDITESLREKEALQESEEKYAKLFRHSNDMIFLHDTEGWIIEVNERVTETLGYSHGELLRLNVRDLHPNDALESSKQAFSKLVKHGSTRFEILFLTKKGEKILAEVSASRFETGEKTLIQGIARDISKRRRTESELRRAKQEWENIFQLMGQPAFIIGTDQRIQKVNQAALTAFDSSEEDLIGSLCYEKLPCKNTDGKKCPHPRTMATGQCVTDQIDVDIEGQSFIVSTSPILDENGAITAVVHITIDITEQRVQAEKKQQLAMEMQQAQKLESLGLMAGGIAHDFNNLLVGVLGNADLALLEVDRKSRIRPYLERIMTGSTRLSELTNQMLAFSGKGTFVLKPLNISKLVKEMIPLAQTSASKKITFQADLATALPPIEADSTQIQQVILNLLTNAFEAIGDCEGNVSISTGIEPTNPSTGKNLSLTQNRVYLQVRDTGSGVSEENRTKIFDPFFSTKFTGRGLGLATVQGIVRSHHGEIHLTTVPGEGSTFTVFFPASPKTYEADAAPGDDTSPKSYGTVLVVDDEAVVREVAATMLSLSGFKVITAVDGSDALSIIHDENAIDAVILDLTMPNMDGFDTFSRLQKVCPEIPVILSSGYSEQAAIAKFKHKGLAGFIQKPYRIQELVTKVRSVLFPESE